MQSFTLPASQVLHDTGQLNVYHKIFTNSTDALALIDPSGVYIEQNTAHSVMTGYSDAELAGQTPAIHLGRVAFAQISEALARTGHYRGEHTSRAKDGTIRTIDMSAFGVYDEQGQLTCYVTRERDLTELKRSQTAMLHRYAQLQAIYRMTAAASQADALVDIYEEALTCLEAALGCNRSAVLLFDPDGVMRFKASHNLSDTYRRGVEGHSPWSITERNPQPIGISDVAAADDLRALRPVVL